MIDLLICAVFFIAGAAVASLVIILYLQLQIIQPIKTLQATLEKEKSPTQHDTQTLKTLLHNIEAIGTKNPAIQPLCHSLQQFSQALDAQLTLLNTIALGDPLTQLPNRRHYFKHLKTALHHLTRTHKPIALMLIDLDGFKPVNDTLGHEAGDSLLKEVGVILRANIRQEDFLARFGGDEFTIIVQGCDDHRVAQRIAENILKSLKQQLRIGEHRIRIGASIGISMTTKHNLCPQEFTHQADQAMYTAKKMGRNQVAFWSPHYNPVTPGCSKEEAKLIQALQQKTLTCIVHPQVAYAHPQKIIGARVVPALRPLKIGSVDQPIHIAEAIIQQSDNPRLVLPYYRWLIHTLSALTQSCQNLSGSIHHPLPLTVSVPPNKIHLAGFLQAFKVATAAKKIDPGHLLVHLSDKKINRLHQLPLAFIQSQENQQLLCSLRLSIEIPQPQDSLSLLSKVPNQLVGRIEISAQNCVAALSEEDELLSNGLNTLSDITTFASRFACQVFITDIDTPEDWHRFEHSGITGAQGKHCAAQISISEFIDRLRSQANSAHPNNTIHNKPIELLGILNRDKTYNN